MYSYPPGRSCNIHLIHVEFFGAIKTIKLIDDMEKLSCLRGSAMRITRLAIKYNIVIDVRVLRDT